MDLTTFSSLFTVGSFLLFIVILWWAYNGSQNKSFAEAARIPFEEDDDLEPVTRNGRANESKEQRP